jgi:hypothetical protein
VKQWSAAICSGFARWQQQLTRLASTGVVGSLLHGVGAPADPEAIRVGIPLFLGNVLAATDRLNHDITNAGAPKIKDGAAIVTRFANSIQFLAGEFSAFKAKAELLQPDDPRSQFAESQDLPALLQAAGTVLSTTLSETAAAYPTSRLTKTFASTKACKPLL